MLKVSLILNNFANSLRLDKSFELDLNKTLNKNVESKGKRSFEKEATSGDSFNFPDCQFYNIANLIVALICAM